MSAGKGGILTDALASAVRDRGWQAIVLSVDPADAARARVQSDVDKGRPLIALIDVGSHVYHYVVIVGSTDQEVVVHDPARAPFDVLSWAEFDRAWAATGRWMMLVLPPEGFRAAGETAAAAVPSATAAAPVADQTPCAALVAHSVQLARAGDSAGAEQGLVAATHLCPRDPAPWQELGGLRFSQSRWSEARDLGLAAVHLAPDDTYAWQLVATSRYLLGDATGALDAWNHIGEPRLDTTDIHGARRTRQPVIARATGLRPRQVLTSEAFARALRRLRALPVAADAQVRYEPIEGGRATLDVVIRERPAAPRGWVALAALGGRALLYDELHADVAGPWDAGDMEHLLWRWSAARPRVSFDVAVPSSRWVSGVVSFEGLWERQSYGAAPASPDAAPVRESRRRVGLRLTEWRTSRIQWQAGAALDRLREYGARDSSRVNARDYLALTSGLDVRLAGDRLALAASGGWWTPFAGGDRFGTGEFLVAWRSTSATAAPAWSALAAVDAASRVAPLALWSGAGTGPGRSALLRAHPLLENDVVTGAVFGRSLAHGSLEYARPIGPAPLLGSLSVAGFVDAARAWRRRDVPDASPLYIDAGIGLRLRAPGESGKIRLDLAHGLRGGGFTLSAGWGVAWPG